MNVEGCFVVVLFLIWELIHLELRDAFLQRWLEGQDNRPIDNIVNASNDVLDMIFHLTEYRVFWFWNNTYLCRIFKKESNHPQHLTV